MLGRAIYILPALAVAMAALVMLGPGAARPALGARVVGSPRAGGRVLGLRLEVVRSLFGVEDAASAPALHVVAVTRDGPVGEWDGATDGDGIAEVRIGASSPIEGAVAVHVTTQGRLLVEGTFVPPGGELSPARR